MSDINRIIAGGSFSSSEIEGAAAAMRELNSQLERLKGIRQAEIEAIKNKMSQETQFISQNFPTSQQGPVLSQMRSDFSELINQARQKHQPGISSIQRLMSRSQPMGLNIDPSGSTVSDITVQTLQSELEKMYVELERSEVRTGSRSLSRRNIGPMASRILGSIEAASGTTLEKDRVSIQEKLISQTQNFIDKNKDSSKALDAFNNEFSETNSIAKESIITWKEVKNSLNDAQKAFIGMAQVSTGLSSIMNAVSQGNLGGIFTGGTSLMRGIGNAAGGGARLGGRFGKFGGIIGGTLGVAGAGIGGLMALGSIGFNAQVEQMREAAQYEEAAFRLNLLQGGVGLPTSEGIESLIGTARGGALTLPQYGRAAITARGGALGDGGSIIEMARFSQIFGRPLQETANHVGTIARATGTSFESIVRSMHKMSGYEGMGGTIFTGEMQRTFSQLAQFLTKEFGGVRGAVGAGGITDLMSPMLAAGISPSQIGGVAGNLQSYATGALKDVQKRMMLSYLGMPTEAIEFGMAGGESAANLMLGGLGLSQGDLESVAKTGRLPSAFGRISAVTGESDPVKAIGIASRYLLGFSTSTTKAMMAMAENEVSIVKLKSQLDGMTEGSKEYNSTLKQIKEKTGDFQESQEAFNKTLKDQEALMSFKEKLMSISASIAKATQGFIGGTAIPELLQDIANRMEPIKAIFGDMAEGWLVALSKSIQGISEGSTTFRKLMHGAVGSLAGDIANAGKDIIRQSVNRLIETNPKKARLLGLEADYTLEELRSDSSKMATRLRSGKELSEEEAVIAKTYESNLSKRQLMHLNALLFGRNKELAGFIDKESTVTPAEMDAISAENTYEIMRLMGHVNKNLNLVEKDNIKNAPAKEKQSIQLDINFLVDGINSKKFNVVTDSKNIFQSTDFSLER